MTEKYDQEYVVKGMVLPFVRVEKERLKRFPPARNPGIDQNFSSGRWFRRRESQSKTFSVSGNSDK